MTTVVALKTILPKRDSAMKIRATRHRSRVESRMDVCPAVAANSDVCLVTAK
jgi:hypothetical protein